MTVEQSCGSFGIEVGNTEEAETEAVEVLRGTHPVFVVWKKSHDANPITFRTFEYGWNLLKNSPNTEKSHFARKFCPGSVNVQEWEDVVHKERIPPSWKNRKCRESTHSSNTNSLFTSIKKNERSKNYYREKRKL